MDGAAGKAADMVAERAKQRAPDAPPIGVGIVSAIHVEHVEHGVWRVVGGDEDHWWGHFLEYGTQKMSPRPYMGPAAEETRGEYTMLAGAALKAL